MNEQTRLFQSHHSCFNVHRVKMIAGEMAHLIKFGKYDIKNSVIQEYIVHIFELMLRLELTTEKQVTPEAISALLPAEYLELTTQKSSKLQNNICFKSLSLLVKHIKIQSEKQNPVQQIFAKLLDVFYRIPELVTTEYGIVYLQQSNYYAGAYRKHHTTLMVNYKTVRILPTVNGDK